MNHHPLTTLSRFMMGIAWASCWPAAFHTDGAPHPGLILLGAGFAILPDCLDDWLIRPFHRPDIHIVPPPEAPDPHMIAAALTQAVALSHNSGKPLDLVCYPLPVGPNQWRPYSLLLDSAHHRISVILDDPEPICGTATTPTGLLTDQSRLLTIHTQPLSLRIARAAKNRVIIMIMPAEQQWTHSLVTASATGIIAATLWGLTAGAIACGAHALHILSNQWAFTGSALFWPITRKRYPGFQWLKPHQNHKADSAIMWGSFLLIIGNMLHSAIPPIVHPSLFQLILFGGVIPFAIGSCFPIQNEAPMKD